MRNEIGKSDDFMGFCDAKLSPLYGEQKKTQKNALVNSHAKSQCVYKYGLASIKVY
mgnify:CR=1 FL=1